jgi:Zn-finger nucleic acid-binding protein
VTTEECISNVLSSPDLKCPVCQKHLEVWVFGEVPIHRCSICGGMGFKLEKDQLGHFMSRAKTSPEPEMICPGCGSGLIKASLGRLKVDSCQGCHWVFVEDSGDLRPDEDTEGGDCSHYESVLRSLGKRYELLLSRL